MHCGTEVTRLGRSTGLLQNASRKVLGFLSGALPTTFRLRGDGDRGFPNRTPTLGGSRNVHNYHTLVLVPCQALFWPPCRTATVAHFTA